MTAQNKPKAAKPAQTKQNIEFACEYLPTHGHVKRVRDPLPFPDNLTDVIAWTDAFVDRIASLTSHQEKANTQKVNGLNSENEKLRTQLKNAQSELEKARKETAREKGEKEAAQAKFTKEHEAFQAHCAAHKLTIEELNCDLGNLKSENERHHKEIRELNANLGAVTKSRDELQKKLQNTNASLAKEHTEWEEANKLHIADHDALKKERDLFLAERKLKEQALGDLKKVRSQLATANLDIQAKQKEIEVFKAKITEQLTELENTKKHNAELHEEICSLKTSLDEEKTKLTVATEKVAALEEELKAAREAIAKLDKELKDTQATVATLQAELKKTTDEKVAAESKVVELTAELKKANECIKSKNAELGEKETEITSLNEKSVAAMKVINSLLGQNETLENNRKVHEKKDEAHREEDKAHKAVDDAHTALDKAHTAVDTAHAEDDEARNKNNESEQPEDSELKEALRTLTGVDPGKVKQLEAEIAELKSRLIPNAHGRRINILSVEYGRVNYTPAVHKKVFDKLYEHVENGTPFQVDNDFFGGDPWPRHCKSCSITYQLDGRGAPIHLVCEEGKYLQFK